MTVQSSSLEQKLDLTITRRERSGKIAVTIKERGFSERSLTYITDDRFGKDIIDELSGNGPNVEHDSMLNEL